MQFHPRRARVHGVSPQVQQPVEAAQRVAGEDGAGRRGGGHLRSVEEALADTHDEGGSRQVLPPRGNGLAVGDALQQERRAVFVQRAARRGVGGGGHVARRREEDGAPTRVSDLAQQRGVAVGDDEVAMRGIAVVEGLPAHAVDDFRRGAAIEDTHHVAARRQRPGEADDGFLPAAEGPLVRRPSVERDRVVEKGDQHRAFALPRRTRPSTPPAL